MKKIFLGVVLLLAGCGGGGGDTAVVASHVPTISGLSYSPQTFAQGSGTATANLSFNFYDAGADINQVTITIQDATTSAVLTSTHTPVTTGTAGGILHVTVQGSTATAGNYLFNVHVNDAQGNYSMPLTGSFSVI